MTSGSTVSTSVDDIDDAASDHAQGNKVPVVGCSRSACGSTSEDESYDNPHKTKKHKRDSEENPPKAKRRKHGVHKSANQTKASKDTNQTKGHDTPEDAQQGKSSDSQQAEHTKTQQDTIDKKNVCILFCLNCCSTCL